MGNQEQVTPFYKTLGKVLSLVTVSLILFSCTPQPEVEEALEDAVTVPGASLPPLPDLGVQCYQERYQIPEEAITRKIDILIVPDTSGSIKDERAAIADGFDSFLGMLPSIADVRVGVVLGHGSTSARSGKLYQRGTEPLILDNQIHTMDEIKTHLRTKMYNPHTDGASDGGEEGLFSLNKSLSETNFQAIQDQGFYRDDAALVVVFVADEQDVCAAYPEGVTPVPDPQGKEDSSFTRDCVDGDGNRIITPEIVLSNLKARAGEKPLVVGGVLYNNLNTIPYKGENELGYGYLETIEQSGGITVDMANGDYGNGLSKLGLLAMTKMEPINHFNPKVSNIDKDTIRTFVNGVEVAHTYDIELNIVSLTQARDTFSIADLQYCEKPKVSKEVVQIATGAFHSCALIANGEVKCWGDNAYGQLGQGNKVNLGDDEIATSIPAIDLNGERAIQVTTGASHTCVLTETYKVKCFGRNEFGQLGLGHTNHMGDDEPISSIPYLDLGTNIRKLYSGTYHNCALFTNGTIKCWGDNRYGQLGISSTENIGDNETLATSPNVSISGSAIQMDLSTLSYHACAILDGGNLYCWGWNQFGQLGLGHKDNIGDDESISSIAKAQISKPAIMVTTGARHTCALLSDSNVTCFGGNNTGQLGRGHKDQIGDDELPKDVPNIDIGFESKFIYAGNITTCAISTNNEAKCWGHGGLGKLGQGNTNMIGDDELPSSIPVISLGAEVESVAGGSNHTCFLTKDKGHVKCIGQGTKGQLGYGHTLTVGDDELPSSFDFLKFLDL